MGKVMAICISEIRGVQKKNVHTARLIENWGVEHDAHAGNWHRQVSLLSYETIQDFNEDWNQIPLRRCGSGTDSDRQRVP